MFILANFIKAVALIVNYCLQFYKWIIIARFVLSWVNPDPYNQIVRFVYKITDPVLKRVSSYVPVQVAGLDFSPMIVLLGIFFLEYFLVGSLLDFAKLLS